MGRKAKKKPQLGVSYIATSFQQITHQFGLVLAYKRVDFTTGVAMQYPNNNPFENPVGYPYGGFFNVHYASGKPKASFRFTFDFLLNYMHHEFKPEYDMGSGYNTQIVVYTLDVDEFIASLGPGFQVRLTEGCTIRFAALLPTFVSRKFSFTILQNGKEHASQSTHEEFIFPGDSDLNFKLGINYVFQY